MHFPNARILVYNYLTRNGGDCYSATISAAKDLGLLSDEAFGNFKSRKDIFTGSCGAMCAAREILDYGLAKKSIAIADQAWAEIEEKVESYKHFLIPQYNQHKTIDKNSCIHLAPVVLDVLLQYLLSHL